jgi:hypothetical protein
MRKNRRYRGEFREIGELDRYERIEIAKPDDLTATEFRKRITNAVVWLTASRDRRFRTRTNPKTGGIIVERTHTSMELLTEMGIR